MLLLNVSRGPIVTNTASTTPPISSLPNRRTSSSSNGLLQPVYFTIVYPLLQCIVQLCGFGRDKAGLCTNFKGFGTSCCCQWIRSDDQVNMGG